MLPAEPAYAALLDVLGDRVDAVAKDLEVYAGEEPPPDFSLATEVEGIVREADAHQFERFHLVGYSGGGASSLAFTGLHGDRLLSLALLEPAWAGNQRTEAEEALMQRFRALEALPPDEFMTGFLRLQLAPGVEPPPPPEGPTPPWMAKRPAGLRAFINAFDEADLDLDALRPSIGRSTSRLAAAATPITTAEWPNASQRSSLTAPSRHSPSAAREERRK